MTGLSILFHALFFSGVLFLPHLRSSRQFVPSAVEVDLVSLPGAAPESQPASPEVSAPAEPLESVEPAKPEAEPVEPVPPKPEEVSEKPVSVAPSALEVKRSLKKKTFDASKVIKSAIAKIEKEAPVSRPHSVRQAIDKLRTGVDSEKGVFLRGGMGTGGVGKKTLELLDIYNAEIWHRIYKNWSFNKELAGGRTDWEATIIVKITKKGEIRDVWFEKRSGNTYFDDSVFKAVKKSDPLPLLPESFRGPFYEVGLRFNLSELQRGF
jgi:colicin import membrane protein